MVPVESTKTIGIRHVIGKNEVKEVLSVLEQDESTIDANWNQRFRNNIEKLRSGNVYQLAEVIRDLSIRKRSKGLSAGDTRMVVKARRLLISELTCATEAPTTSPRR